VRFFERLELLDAPKRIRSIVLVRISSIAPLISPAYSAGLTETQVRERSWTRLQQLYGSTGGRLT
jgi:hypothetical protein